MSISDTVGNLHQTPVDPSSLDLTGFADKATGAWPKGWYPAEIIPGFDKGGHQFASGTSASSKGDSFNVLLCMRIQKDETVTDVKDIRTDFTQLNYRLLDFTPERMQTVKNLRESLKDVAGRWDGYTDEQRSSLALGKLGQLQSASGAPLTFLEDGAINVIPFIGRKLYIYYDLDAETGYNKVTRFSKYATGVEPKPKKAKAKK